ncbi:hemerythrin domain-containing protein [Thiorhodococcus minor]|uniref:Hemerythrin family protein n=1 Tax=Thiorhodococcus minor TaxID=57489 RepID=A0A6M0K6W2_9GAMM|nr:hemerythrin family protein [Thiorhodococcus minor]
MAALQGLAANSLKQIISWSSDFEIDDPAIDSQHERIFDLALEACELSRAATGIPALIDLLEKLDAVLGVHFRAEEQMLAEIDYPRLSEHRAEHNAILVELDFIRQRLASGSEGWAIHQQTLVVTNFMIGVTVGHILRSDSDYAQYMQRDMLPPPG